MSAPVVNITKHLTAPFPWYGGKRRWSDRVLMRFGLIDVYSEPFAGSLAVLLASAPHKRGKWCATRTVASVTFGARSPRTRTRSPIGQTIRRFMTIDRPAPLPRALGPRARGRLRNDPEYYDAKVAGWWVWGISIWIGGGWCQAELPQSGRPGSDPEVCAHGTGVGVESTESKMPPGAQPRRWPAPAWRRRVNGETRREMGKVCSRHETGRSRHERATPHEHCLSCRSPNAENVRCAIPYRLAQMAKASACVRGSASSRSASRVSSCSIGHGNLP